MTELLLARHGRAVEDGGPSGVGPRDRARALDPLGRAQARALGERLEGAPPGVLLASPYARTRETAALAGRVWGMEPEVDEDLREFVLTAGELDDPGGLAAVWERLRREPGAPALPGGDAVADFQRRVWGALDRLVETHAGERILVVTHAGTLKAAFVHLLGLPPERTFGFSLQIDHAGLFGFRRTRPGGSWRLLFANRTDHLRDLGAGG